MRDFINTLINNGKYKLEKDKLVSVDTLVENIKTIYKDYFDEKYIENNFKLTDNMKSYLNNIDGLLFQGDWIIINSKSDIIKCTKYFAKRGRYENYKKMYLHLGHWSDKHDLVFCCDESSEKFGLIIDVCDFHPWEYDSFGGDATYETIEAMLNDL